MCHWFDSSRRHHLCGSGSVVERHLAKVNVASSNLVFRSKHKRRDSASFVIWRHSQVVRHGSATPLFPSSSLGGASRKSTSSEVLFSMKSVLRRNKSAFKKKRAEKSARFPFLLRIEDYFFRCIIIKIQHQFKLNILYLCYSALLQIILLKRHCLNSFFPGSIRTPKSVPRSIANPFAYILSTCTCTASFVLFSIRSLYSSGVQHG